MQRAQGNLDDALTAYEDSLDISEKLAAQDPSNAGWQRDLSVSYDKIGDVQSARGNLDGRAQGLRRTSLAIREKLAAQDPSNTGWQRDLSVSFNKIGDVQSARGNLDAALKAYRDSLAIAREAGRAGPEQRRWQRDLSGSSKRIRQFAAGASRPEQRALCLLERPCCPTSCWRRTAIARRSATS